MNDNQLKWFYLTILSLIWGSSFILIKRGLVGLTPMQLGALRIVFAAIFLLVIGFKNIKEIKPKHWKWVAWSGFLGSFFPPFLFAIAQTKIDSSVASVLNSLTPINTVIIGITLFGFIVTKRQILGVFIGLIGTLILISQGGEIDASQNYWYAFLIVVASFGYAFNVNILKRHLVDLSAMAISVGHFLLIGLPALVVLYFTNFFSTVFESKEMQVAMIYILVLAVLCTAVSKILFNKLIKIATPVFATSVTYTIPLMAVFLGVLDGEKMNFMQVSGGAIILLGVYLANRKKQI